MILVDTSGWSTCERRRALKGRGIGFVDVHLLASAALAATVRLWTRDRRLAVVATDHDLLRS